MRIIIEIDPQQLQVSPQQQGSSGAAGNPGSGSGAGSVHFGGAQDAGAAPTAGGGESGSTNGPMLPFSYTAPPDQSSFGSMGGGNGHGMNSAGFSRTGTDQSAGAAPGAATGEPTGQTSFIESDE